MTYAICLVLMQNLVFADESYKNEGRFHLGFYGHSISEVASRSDIEVSMNFWTKDLLAEESRKININLTEIKAILYDSMQEMREAMLKGELDMIVGPPLLISKYFKREELADGFTGMLEGKRDDNILLIARNTHNISDIKDLKGKRLLVLEDDEFSEIFIDTLFLKQFNTSYKKIASSVEQQIKASRVVLDIYFNKADAGVVYRNSYEVMIELNPDIANATKIIAEYPMKSKNFGYFVKGYPYAETMSKMAVNLFSKNSRSKQILEVFKTSELGYCSVQDLDGFDNYYNEYKKLKKRAR
jgi:phosphonate transport system substrate-binding protein